MLNIEKQNSITILKQIKSSILISCFLSCWNNHIFIILNTFHFAISNVFNLLNTSLNSTDTDKMLPVASHLNVQKKVNVKSIGHKVQMVW